MRTGSVSVSPSVSESASVSGTMSGSVTPASTDTLTRSVSSTYVTETPLVGVVSVRPSVGVVGEATQVWVEGGGFNTLGGGDGMAVVRSSVADCSGGMWAAGDEVARSDNLGPGNGVSEGSAMMSVVFRDVGEYAVCYRFSDDGSGGPGVGGGWRGPYGRIAVSGARADVGVVVGYEGVPSAGEAVGVRLGYVNEGPGRTRHKKKRV